MASYKLLLLFMIVNLMNFVITKAQDDDFRWGYSCSTRNKTTPNSAFQRKLRTLLSYLSSNATTGNKEFYKTSVASRNHSDAVYGMFACWGNIPPNLCKQCVANATPSNVFKSPLESDCYLSNQVLISSDECSVRYSYNRSFVFTVDLAPSSECTTANVSKQARLIKHLLISETIKEATATATNGGKKYYATKQARISASGFQSLFCEAQCTPDLSPQDCRNCLNATATAYCGQSLSANSRTASCRIRYDVYPFYRPATGSAPPPGLLPSTSSVSNYSLHSSYLSHNCTYSSETSPTNTAFLSNLRTLLSYLSSNATTKTGFFKTTVTGTKPSDTVNGLFMCRGDISPSLCQLCVLNATERISLECSSSKEAIIWYDHCLLRYSDRSSLSDVDTDPSFHDFTIANTSSSSILNQQQQSFFTWILADALYKVQRDTGDSTIKNYRTRSVKLNDHQTIYTLAQCTPDQSTSDCYTCLQNIFENAIPWCCLASPEGKVLYPSCYIMFGLSKFYSDGDEAQAYGLTRSPSPTSTTAENKKGRATKTTMLIVIPIVSAVLLSCCCCCCLVRRKARKSNYKTLLKKNFGEESTTLESLQYSLATIKAATNNFSQDNKIGKGGFGEVYKGILGDGRYIAVKRLSISSKQGSIEFTNEVLLIAKLQHRNLVTLIGFCLEEQEKILIYEYMPNGSLDYLLFDTQQQKLSWAERYKIISGTASGILYLHEYSRLKVIHRDLKPSNILLDEKMNPKLSDFGMARMVEMDQDSGNTNRIAGTYGYMSPEYAMLGQFSEKSDVFSFGVMILEIITGKRNTNSHESHNIVEGLVSYVWRQWKNQTPLSILDPSMKPNYSEIEVNKCIQIGLLCVQENPNARPTMTTIISYLNTHSQELPFPQEPAFFLHNRMDPEMVAQEGPNLGQYTNGSKPHSLNKMFISEFYPR